MLSNTMQSDDMNGQRFVAAGWLPDFVPFQQFSADGDKPLNPGLHPKTPLQPPRFLHPKLRFLFSETTVLGRKASQFKHAASSVASAHRLGTSIVYGFWA